MPSRLHASAVTGPDWPGICATMAAAASMISTSLRTPAASRVPSGRNTSEVTGGGGAAVTHVDINMRTAGGTSDFMLDLTGGDHLNLAKSTVSPPFRVISARSVPSSIELSTNRADA